MRRLLARGRLLRDGKIAVLPDVRLLCQCDCGSYFARLDFMLHVKLCPVRQKRRKG